MSVGVVRERPLRELESEIRRAQALLALLKQSFSTPHEFPDQRLILSEQPLNTQVPLPSIRKNTNNDLVLVPLVSLFRGAPLTGFVVDLKIVLSKLTSLVASAYSSGITDISCPIPVMSMAPKIRIKRLMLEYTSVRINVFVGA